jgi:hypothetical protein
MALPRNAPHLERAAYVPRARDRIEVGLRLGPLHAPEHVMPDRNAQVLTQRTGEFERLVVTTGAQAGRV